MKSNFNNITEKANIVLNNILSCSCEIERLKLRIETEDNKPESCRYLFDSKADCLLNIKAEEKYIEQYKKQYNKLITGIKLF